MVKLNQEYTMRTDLRHVQAIDHSMRGQVTVNHSYNVSKSNVKFKNNLNQFIKIYHQNILDS